LLHGHASLDERFVREVVDIVVSGLVWTRAHESRSRSSAALELAAH
jgi:hypothetical protein